MYAGEIDTIRITQATASDAGITGNITANRGTINQILTTGKIGTSGSARSTISAGRGITRIRAAADPDNPALDRSFFADIKTNLFGTLDDFTLVARALNLLETAGNFVGSIEADFIRNDPSMANGDNLGTDWGVIVAGSFTGDIRVRHSVLDASIAATTFTSPTTEHPNQGHITIDHALEGSIVATGIDGYIPFISVGRTPLSTTLPGFIGSKAEPQTFPFVPFTPASSPRFAPMPAQSEPDSVIAAA